MPVSKSLLRSLSVAAALAAALTIGLLALGGGDDEPDYRPLAGETALDSWRAPWEGAGPAADGCGALPRKWLMVDWDAADWDLVLPLVAAGELPNLERLMRAGAYGNLDSFQPSISPAIWTTIATGLSPAEHGIRHFYNRRTRWERLRTRLSNFGAARRQLYSNADRRAPAIWNLLSERGLSVLIAGYHNTFPAERVEGMIVSNYLTQDSVADLMQMESSASEFATSLVHPPEHLERVLEIQRRTDRALPAEIGRFVALEDDGALRRYLRAGRELDLDGDQRPYFLSRAWLYDEVIARVAERFYGEIDPTLAIVHFQSLDWAAHHFLYFDQPERYAGYDWEPGTRAELEALIPLYSDTVDAFYRNADAWLGRLLELIDESTAVLLLSDHGTGPGPDPDLPGNHDDAPPGLIVLQGPGIRSGHRIEGASIYDVLPTLMAALDLPVAEDLPGRALDDAFCADAWAGRRAERVASYRTGESFTPPISRPEALDDDLLKQLESLGYLD